MARTERQQLYVRVAVENRGSAETARLVKNCLVTAACAFRRRHHVVQTVFAVRNHTGT